MLAVRKDYAAPTGLGNGVARMAAKISLRTELWWPCASTNSNGVESFTPALADAIGLRRVRD